LIESKASLYLPSLTPLKIGDTQQNQNLRNGEAKSNFSDTVYWSSKLDRLCNDFSRDKTFNLHSSSTISIPSSKDIFARLKAEFVLLSPRARPLNIVCATSSPFVSLLISFRKNLYLLKISFSISISIPIVVSTLISSPPKIEKYFKAISFVAGLFCSQKY
jgi:hypothetical protein